MHLLNKVALITGSARRVGCAIAFELADAGCDIAIHYGHSHEQANMACAQIKDMGRRCITLQADLSDSSTWESLITDTVQQLGQLDILVNNASTFLTTSPDTIEAFDIQAWEKMLRVNLLSAAALSHFAEPHLKANGIGKIINLCDIASQRPWPKHLSYCVSKGALETLTLGLAKALSPLVQVNGVAPGIAEFPTEFSEETRAKLIDQVPLKRPGTPVDVAKLVRYLVEHGDYITGQIIPIDGGRSLR